jgi:hypothetical protein
VTGDPPGDWRDHNVLFPPGVCSCGIAGEHTFSQHDREITERAEQASGVTPTPDGGDEGGFVLGPDDVLVINHGPKAYPLALPQVVAFRSRCDEVMPGLGARVLNLAVQDVLIARGTPPSAADQSRRWRAEMAGQFAQDMVPQPAPTTYVRVADVAAELGVTEDDVLSAASQASPVMFMVGQLPSGRSITNHDAERARALLRREQDERDEGATQRVEALDLEDEHGRAMDDR